MMPVKTQINEKNIIGFLTKQLLRLRAGKKSVHAATCAKLLTA